MNLCATQDVYQLGPFLLREIFYSLLLDWFQIWMRKLYHDAHVMNTQLAIYDAYSRCWYMQIEIVQPVVGMALIVDTKGPPWCDYHT